MFSWKSNWLIPQETIPAWRFEGRQWPQLRRLDLPEGRYRIMVSLQADKDCEEVLAFIGRRHLVWKGTMHCGQQVAIHTTCDVAPLISGVDALPETPGGVWLAVIGKSVRIVGFEAVPDPDMQCIYLMGDSTVTDQPADVPYAPGACYAGWGQMLQYMISDTACVSNHAHGGLTCEAFRSEGHYAIVHDRIHAGDLALIQFGHNDQKRMHLQAAGGYRERIIAYVRELREKDAIPVLVTSLARNHWFPDGAYNDMLQAYAAQIIRIGHEMDVPVIDLHGWMMKQLLREGDQGAAWRFHDQDRTHTNDFGAYEAASFIAQELAKLGLARTEEVSPWPFYGPVEALTAPVYTKKQKFTEAPAPVYTMTAEADDGKLVLTWSVPVDATEETSYCIMVNGVMLERAERNECTLSELQPDTVYELAVFDMPKGRLIACSRARTNR